MGAAAPQLRSSADCFGTSQRCIAPAKLHYLTQEWRMSLRICQLGPNEIFLLQALLDVFAQAFQDVETYSGKRPAVEYHLRLLGRDDVIALAASVNGECAGGLVAYELRKFEQQRSEVSIYDLAVCDRHRRKGIATALINKLKEIAARHAYMIFVQADIGDDPAIALYTRLGVREDVLHFDIAVIGGNDVVRKDAADGN